MNRREFITTAGIAAAGMAAVGTQARAADVKKQNFKLKYAPHFGMFEHHAGKDLIDQLKFVSDVGFKALEDNGMRGRDVATQEKIANEMARLGLELGVFVATADFQNVNFAQNSQDIRDFIKKEMTASVEVAKRVNTKYCTVVPGCYDKKLAWDYQTANVIDNLRYAAEICEPSGLIMVLESLNHHTDHPGLFLSKIPQAYMICRAVDSPSCKILDDLYHQQVTEGNLINNMDMAWNEIAYIQVGDNPGRKEPGTGEINYRNVFKHIHAKDPSIIIGMEHGISKPGLEGEKALIQAYVDADNF